MEPYHYSWCNPSNAALNRHQVMDFYKALRMFLSFDLSYFPVAHLRKSSRISQLRLKKKIGYNKISFVGIVLARVIIFGKPWGNSFFQHYINETISSVF
jgi:hypothetical protein